MRRRSTASVQRYALETAAWAQHHFGSLTASREIRLRTLRKLERDGLLVSAGHVAMCDADGAVIIPERRREGWRLTQDGVDALVTTSSVVYLRGPNFKGLRIPRARQGNNGGK